MAVDKIKKEKEDFFNMKKKYIILTIILFLIINFCAVKYFNFTNQGQGGADENVKTVSENKYILTGKITSPVKNGVLTSKFGMREHPITKKNSFHTGIDIASKKGTPIFSSFSGIVEEIGYNEVYGNFITMRHSDSLTTFYGHCDSIKVSHGMRIRSGEVIAEMGSTGYSTGPHLHFEIRINSIRVNPMLALGEKDNFVD